MNIYGTHDMWLILLELCNVFLLILQSTRQLALQSIPDQVFPQSLTS